MNYDTLLKILKTQFGKDPLKGENSDTELGQEDVIPFLLDTSTEGDIPIYVSYNGLFIYSIALPEKYIPVDPSEIVHYSVNVAPCFGFWYGGGKASSPDAYVLAYPSETNSPSFLSKGIPLTSLRDYRFNEEKHYIEFPQDFTQIFALHRDDETHNMCRVDRNGDKEAICRISLSSKYNIVTVKSGALFSYLHLKHCVLVRVFESYRSQVNIPSWTEYELIDKTNRSEEIYAHFMRNDPSTLLRGGQFIGLDRNFVWKQSKQEFIYVPDKRCCDFLTHDWKNNRITTCNCSPEATSNYFEPKNDKPYGTSPVFFKPEVLDKYKNNPDKYELKNRHISKTDGWYLQTYDINEVGQVHTYLCYLSNLPYEEQLYWKAFNENPKGPISKRAFQTDFKGTWSDIKHPDEILVGLLTQAKEKVPFFKSIQTGLINRIHRVHTDNQKEWSDSILLLDQVIVEAMDYSQIQSAAKAIGCFISSLKSIKQLQTIFNTLGYDPGVLEPLAEMHDLRSKISSHRQGDEARRLIKDIRRRFNSFPKHSEELLKRICEAIEFLLEHHSEIGTYE